MRTICILRHPDCSDTIEMQAKMVCVSTRGCARVYTLLLTLFSSCHVLLQFEFLLAQLQYSVLNAIFTDQLDDLDSPNTQNQEGGIQCFSLP